MKRLTALIMLLAMLCPLILGCDSSTPMQNDSHTISPDSGAAANQTVAVADIEPNEVVIETTPYAWGVKYLEVPEDDWSNSGPMRGISLETDNVYYDKKENVIKLMYLSFEKESSNSIYRLAVYDTKGNLIRTEDIPMPDLDVDTNLDVKLTEYGYIDMLKQSDSYMLYKYYTRSSN